MKFVIPESIGSEVRVFPEDTYEFEIQDLFLGVSKQSQKPKITLKLICQTEYSGPKDANFKTTVGDPLLETISLQEQAIWKLNDYYKGATGERIPAGEMDEEEFTAMLKEALIGSRWSILVKTDTSQGDERSKVDKINAIGKGGKKTVSTKPSTAPPVGKTVRR